ncbi:MAG: DUF1552 domain-containing protein [Polyangiaceae bacterium]|nr:DUF1552 domain-containing protein [Polyangiaceae bacterium]
MKVTRRHVLRGIGGFTLALPFLPSLLSSSEAKAAPTGPIRRFIAMRMDHGGLGSANVYPDDALLTEQMDYAGHTIRRGDLALGDVSGTARLSNVLNAPGSKWTAALAAKMNVVRGLDLPFYIAHHRGGTLGNYGDSDDQQREYVPTCDQVLAWSDKFYGDLSTILQRSAVLGSGSMSWNHTVPSDKNSPIEPLHAENSSLSLFDQLYRDPGNQMEQRTPVVDLVLEDYKRLRDGNRRLSSMDRQRLDSHIAKLDEIQRRLGVTLSCDGVTRPTEDSADLQRDNFLHNVPKHIQFWSLMNDVIVAALSCDTTRIVTLRTGDMWGNGGATGWFHETPLEWHQEVAHKWFQGDRQQILAESNQRFFEHLFLDLVSKLDAVQEADGSTLLDSCLAFWTQESGIHTHDPIDFPIVMAGSAAGWLRTGQYLDYRNMNVVAHNGQGDNDSGEVTHVGLLYNQFLGTAMQAMGLSPADYEVEAGGGYGYHWDETRTWYAGYNKYPASVKNVRGEVLPFLKA